MADKPDNTVVDCDSPANELDELAAKFGTDKCTQKVGSLAPKAYTVQYWRHLAHLRDKPVRLLEIGIAEGASLKMWEAFFKKGRIYGIDILPQCKQYETDRTKVFIGSQTDRAFLRSVIEQIGGPLDAVIDDGGHKMHQHAVSLAELFGHLCSGGLYAIEDLHTAYLARYGGGYEKTGSTVELLKRLTDGVTGGQKLLEQASIFRKLRTRLFGTEPDKLPDVLERIESIHFYRSIAFLIAK